MIPPLESYHSSKALFMWEKNASMVVQTPQGTVWLCSDEYAYPNCSWWKKETWENAYQPAA